MNTMLATTDTMTLTRMAVIGRRTNSALIAGAKAMMVENVKNQMRNGVAHFVYMKKSGELREAFGTTSKALVERHINGNGISREHYTNTNTQTVMQIIVNDAEFTYSYDSSVNDKVVDGFLEEYHPPVEDAIDAALTLLWNVYGRSKIARALKNGVPAMDYDDED